MYLRGVGAPLSSSAPLRCCELRGQYVRVIYIEVSGLAARVCRCSSPLSCFTASLGVMGTVCRERSFVTSPHTASLAAVFITI